MSFRVQLTQYKGRQSDLIEEWVEHEMGQIKRDIQQHGAHRRRDIVRMFERAELAAEAKVTYGTASAPPRVDRDIPADAFGRGIVIVGEALDNQEVQAAFALARRSLDPSLRVHFVELPFFWLITSADCSDPSAIRFDDLAQTHDVLCLCDHDCEHIV